MPPLVRAHVTTVRSSGGRPGWTMGTARCFEEALSVVWARPDGRGRDDADRIDAMTDDIEAVFGRAGCEGALCVKSLDDGAAICLRADESVVPASVVKVQIALEAETWFVDEVAGPA